MSIRLLKLGWPKTRFDWLHLCHVCLLATVAGMLAKEAPMALATNKMVTFGDWYAIILLCAAVLLFILSICISHRSPVLANFGAFCFLVVLFYFAMPRF